MKKRMFLIVPFVFFVNTIVLFAQEEVVRQDGVIITLTTRQVSSLGFQHNCEVVNTNNHPVYVEFFVRNPVTMGAVSIRRSVMVQPGQREFVYIGINSRVQIGRVIVTRLESAVQQRTSLMLNGVEYFHENVQGIDGTRFINHNSHEVDVRWTYRGIQYGHTLSARGSRWNNWWFNGIHVSNVIVTRR